MPLPPSFIDLAAASNSPLDTFVNIIGVVVDIMPARTTTTGSYMMTFKLLDPRLRDSVHVSQGLSVRFFKNDLQSLPKVRQHGDVVLLRKVKMSLFAQQAMALCNHQTEVTVFPAISIPAPNFEIAYQGKQRLDCLGVPLDVKKLTLAEQAYVIQLKHDVSDYLVSLPDRALNGAVVQHDALSPHMPPGPAAMRKQSGEDALALPANVPPAPAAMRKRPGEYLAAPTEPKSMRLSKKFKLIRELQHFDFADLCVEVVKRFPTNSGACEMYVTDYTENKQMYYYSPPEEAAEYERDGDKFSYTDGPKKTWPGPYGSHVLRVDLMDPHAHYANCEVQEGDFVLLQNVKIKATNRLEGNMWPDNLNREKVQVKKQKDLETAEIRALLARKELYWAKRRRNFPDAAQDGEKKKAFTKTEKKKLKKQRAADQAAAAEKVAAQKVSVFGGMKAAVNTHIRCSHEDIPITSIRDVLDPTDEMHLVRTPDGTEYVMPFMSVKYRARVRVVDFRPKQLQDFAQPGQHDAYHYPSSSPTESSRAKQEWCFSLQLEDASKPKDALDEEYRMWIHIDHPDAQYLFGNNIEDPDGLKGNPRQLAVLREKLCILWGNLEERSGDDDEPLSNRPFECCIAEYGIEMDDDDAEKARTTFGFRRCYKMFGVTIL